MPLYLEGKVSIEVETRSGAPVSVSVIGGGGASLVSTPPATGSKLELTLPAGSYQIRVAHTGRSVTRYKVRVEQER
jgi:hypothetical protein